jgi:hypothetical protein
MGGTWFLKLESNVKNVFYFENCTKQTFNYFSELQVWKEKGNLALE